MSEMLEYEIAPLSGESVGLSRPRWTAWLIAFVVLAAAIAVFAMSGGDSPVAREAGPTTGPAAVATNVAPAYVTEGIVYGERVASDVNPGAVILPVYMVEAITYGEMEPPTG